MSVITHHTRIEMNDIHTKASYIMMTGDLMINGEMMTMDRTIFDSMTNDRRTIDNRTHLDSFNIIRKSEMSWSPKMFGDHSMKTEKLVGPQNLFVIFVEKRGTMQISVQ